MKKSDVAINIKNMRKNPKNQKKHMRIITAKEIKHMNYIIKKMKVKKVVVKVKKVM